MSRFYFTTYFTRNLIKNLPNWLFAGAAWCVSMVAHAAEISSTLSSELAAKLPAQLPVKLPIEVNNPVTTSSILQTLVGLIVVLAVIALGAYILRRFGNLPSMTNGVIKVVATVSMGPRDRIVLVQAGEQQLLVGISPGRMQTLCELKSPIEINESDSNKSGSFQNKLFSAIKGQSVTKKT